MAINYNLSKVYALSENDPEFVLQIISLFATEVPQDLAQIALGIKNKDHKQAYAYAHKINPTLDLLGMTMAHEEILQVEAWAKAEGKKKEIEATFESIQNQVDKAIKEIKKDFEI
jgi:HPt (histidine-containing phosphotransfer) domain-containing protein